MLVSQDKLCRDARHRKGYVLMVVLAVSVLVVTVLGTLSRVSLRRALAAADAERSLQQRWGTLTLQKTVLSRAPKVFEQLEETYRERDPGTPPPSFRRDALTLGGVTFDLLLGDEDAKLNLNSVFHFGGQMEAERAISKVGGPQLARTIRLMPAVKPMMLARQSSRLTSADDPDTETTVPDAFRSWGEVFDLPTLEFSLGSEAALPNVTTGITCWGSGQLNFQRASDEAILAVVGTVIQDGGARRMLERYRENPTSSLGILIETEVKSKPDRDRLRSLLSQSSTNFSLWIHASTANGNDNQEWVVMSMDDEGVTRYQKFSR